MNWLNPLTQQVLEVREVPGAQRRALVLFLNELSVICDRHVPSAPPPSLEPPSKGVLQVHWILNDCVFVLGVTENFRCLLTLNDARGKVEFADPSHEELRRCVVRLFEGWKP